MPFSQDHRWYASIGLACVLAPGCVAAPVRETTIHESTRGWVYLAKVSGSRFQASHPISLDPSLITRMLQGIHVQPRQGKPTTLVFGPPTRSRAFSDEEAGFLAPSIGSALGQATVHQAVAFGIIHPMPSGPLTTAGVLYHEGSFLYLTLTHYDSGPGPAPPTDLPDFTKLHQIEVRFSPESAQQTGHVNTATGVPGLGVLTTLAIDYKRLAALPEQPVPAEPGGKERETELERLKKENRSLRHKLIELELEVDRLKQTENRRDRP